jgi:hypothetical protein
VEPTTFKRMGICLYGLGLHISTHHYMTFIAHSFSFIISLFSLKSLYYLSTLSLPVNSFSLLTLHSLLPLSMCTCLFPPCAHTQICSPNQLICSGLFKGLVCPLLCVDLSCWETPLCCLSVCHTAHL